MNPLTASEEGEVIETLPIRASIVKPAVSPEEAIEAWREYENLKKTIITEEDTQQIQGRTFLKKSYWKKCATFFNLSIEVLKEQRVIEADGSITFECTYKATAPNGRFAVGDGACTTTERSGKPNSIHNTRSTASTRAANRAISNLVGGGEVSAEEADQGGENIPSRLVYERDTRRNDYDPNWLITFGKFSKPTPKKISEVPIEDLQSYVAWLETDAAKKGEPMKGNALQLKQFTEMRANLELSKPKHKDQEPPPIEDCDLSEIPF